ncbi:flavin-containing monooxygenase [Thermobifida cellulosilytica]|uniref:FAD-containing monooxygenase EthA n=1 Tax=Thermobifida cellulosilytica TB100 TaxID=665004 RepID=A0A147KFC4_THECS|nr:NAD(P)/FAD-dependent oxidoreductase [Thermobifida cellulosilytica]KUP96011.1 FAD-containing monooxygenase EthA [Thermobifida cellulosilytica TB100]
MPRLPDETSFDVLIVGAGLSGIAAAYYLQRDHPQRSYAILEARDASGGTWDLFRYPGVRSDSDLYTLGYEFRPWRGERAIADAETILAYLRDTAAAHGIDRRIRLRSRVLEASWSSQQARWSVTVEHTDTGEHTTLTCSWLFCAGGYYRYDRGHTPHFQGQHRFGGTIVHPQHWPADLDHAGRRVVVIGSGATAVTLVPALADTAAHVAMVQRTPTYIVPLSSRDRLADRLRALLGDERAHALLRRRSIVRQHLFWRFCRSFPHLARRVIRRANVRMLPEGYPVDVHFNPPYDPWDQRLCVDVGGRLFRAVREGRAEVVTDRIAEFTETGVRLESGRHLQADIVVTATGLAVQAMGGMALTVDGRRVRLRDTVAYKGTMLSGVPNFAYAIGYTNASWTLRVGLVCEHWCRLLAHMDAHGYDTARPVADPTVPTRPLLDFDAGYIRRAVDQLPRQGDRAPWRTPTSYAEDVRLLRRRPVTDPHLHLGRSPAARADARDPAAEPAA